VVLNFQFCLIWEFFLTVDNYNYEHLESFRHQKSQVSLAVVVNQTFTLGGVSCMHTFSLIIVM